MNDGHRNVRARRFVAGVGQAVDEPLAEETPVALLYNGHPHAVMMATPADLEDFAVGFSVSEGLVATAGEVRVVDQVRHGDGIALHLHVPQAAFARFARAQPRRAHRLRALRHRVAGRGHPSDPARAWPACRIQPAGDAVR
jgi:formate dehydrogenase assembly factor FdhD